MLFKDCKFREKNNVRKNMKQEILGILEKEIPYSLCNEGRILEYIDLLLDESDYDIREACFYYKYRYVRIDLSVELFSKVAVEYINEHLNEFLLQKHVPAKK